MVSILKKNDSKGATVKKSLKKLPTWDLSDFYTGTKDKALEQDINKLTSKCTAFQKTYSGKIAKLDSASLYKSILEYSVIQELMGKIGSYAQLLYSGDMMKPENAQFYQNMSDQLTVLSSNLIFYTLEINQLPDAAIKKHLGNKQMAQYASWIRDVRMFKPHQLDEKLEKLLHEKSQTGRNAWSRLFDETIAGLRFPLLGKSMTSAEALDLLSSPDGKKRKAAASVISKVFSENGKVFSLITNTLAKDKEIEDQWRSFTAPISSRNLSNQVEDEVVQALISSVKSNYKNISHRYYKLKAKWFGVKQLNYWDRNAPLPKAPEKSFDWPEATELVLSSYEAFSPTLAKHGKKFFDNDWIDVPVRAGKSPGAFAHPTVPSVHPYLLLNFQGKTRDVMTLAHELGHGVHQVLAAKQGPLMCDTPLTLAETASVFGEQLTFREILRREKDAKRRKSLIAGKVEDMINTVVRQIAFCEFETRVHAERRKGELTSEQIGKIWMDVQAESLGPAIKLYPEYSVYWSYIPHFIHSPFYVYAYAFGDCLVNSLYAAYQAEKNAGRGAQFEKKYIAMLEAGGTLRHKELLKPFGLDASNPNFWNKGLSVLSGLIDELEAIK